MRNQTVLFVMNEATTDGEARQIAAHAAGQNSRLICLILSMVPTYPLSSFGVLPYGGVDVAPGWAEEIAQQRKMLRKRSEAIQAILESEGTSGDVHAVSCVPSDVRSVVARRALVCDAATVSQSLRNDDPDAFHAAVNGVLFESPIPLVLNGLPLDQPECVFLAWNTELPASRAAHAALPMLKAAKEVIIGSFDPIATELQDGEDPGADLAKWLSHQGCTVTINQYPSGGEEIGACIRHRATEVGADLVVMGAFGRSRLQQFVFGGTTRSMTEQTAVKVLMAH